MGLRQMLLKRFPIIIIRELNRQSYCVTGLFVEILYTTRHNRMTNSIVLRAPLLSLT